MGLSGSRSLSILPLSAEAVIQVSRHSKARQRPIGESSSILSRHQIVRRYGYEALCCWDELFSPHSPQTSYMRSPGVAHRGRVTAVECDA